MTTTFELIATTAKQLEGVSTTPRLDGELLIAHVVGLSRESLYTGPELVLAQTEQQQLDVLVQQRQDGVPIAYLVHSKEFYGVNFFVNTHVLVPRPETELLVDIALATAQKRGWVAPTIVDVFTGSGCVALVLQTHLREARVIGTDLSDAALAVARANDHARAVEWIKSDLLQSLPPALRGAVDMIVANPPYVAASVVDSAHGPLMNALQHEPRMALVPQKNGHDTDAMDAITGLVSAAHGWLTPSGVLLCEIGYDQGEASLACARKTFPKATSRIEKDLSGHDRVLVIER